MWLGMSVEAFAFPVAVGAGWDAASDIGITKTVKALEVRCKLPAQRIGGSSSPVRGRATLDSSPGIWR